MNEDEHAEPWIATEGTVTTCRFQFAGLSTMLIGVNLRDKFRITFDYYAHGRLYSDEFQSPVAVPQNTHIPITYNPLDPAQNSRGRHPSASPGSSGKPPVLAVQVAIGLAGSVILSLLWFAVLRGCR
jgi:hypothetical protein